MNKADKMVKRLLTVLVSITLFFTFFSFSPVKAAGTTVEDAGTEITAEIAKELNLDTSKIQTTINHHSGSSSSFPDGYEPEYSMGEGTYKAVYDSALDYFGKKLTVEVEVNLVDNKSQGPLGYTKIFTGDEGRVWVGWREGYNVRVHWKITVIDPDTGDVYPVALLFGFKDPDESNYEFSVDPSNLFYINSDDNAAGHYEFNSKGVFRLDDEGNQIDPATYKKDPGGFNGAEFIVRVDSYPFEFDTVTICEGALGVPYFYADLYKVTYDLQDDEASPATNPESNPSFYVTQTDPIPIADPSRPGYKFTGWTESGVEKNQIDPYSKGDKKFVASWEALKYQIEYKPNEPAGKTAEGEMANQVVVVGNNTLTENAFKVSGYKFVGWNTQADGKGTAYTDKGNLPVSLADTEGKEENAVIKTLYAQWEPITYIVKFDANGGEGEMPNMTDLKYDNVYDLDPIIFTRKGYDLVNPNCWNLNPSGDGTAYTNKQSFENLTEEDGGIVTLYAQWVPWKYFIEYSGGTVGKGTMPMHTYDYSDPTMESDENKFTADGYRFVGFAYTDPGTGEQRLITSTKDFKSIFMTLEKNSVIKLTAQWEAIPEVNTNTYIIPVTGVE